jgi:hypothetical protein
VIAVRRSFDHGLRTRRLDAGAYLVEWPPDAENVSGGDAVVVDVDRAAPAWLGVADVAIRPAGDSGTRPVDAGARNALVVVTGLGGERWLLQVWSDRRVAPLLACHVARAGHTDGLLLGVLAYRWLVSGAPPADLIRTAVLTAERETRRGRA